MRGRGRRRSLRLMLRRWSCEGRRIVYYGFEGRCILVFAFSCGVYGGGLDWIGLDWTMMGLAFRSLETVLYKWWVDEFSVAKKGAGYLSNHNKSFCVTNILRDEDLQ